MPFGSHLACFQSHLKTKFLRFESQLNKSLPLLQVKSKTRLKSCILGLNFVTWPGQGNQATLLFAMFSVLNHSLEDFPLKIFVCHENNQFWEYERPGAQADRHPRFKFILFNKHFPKLVFFLKHFFA